MPTHLLSVVALGLIDFRLNEPRLLNWHDGSYMMMMAKQQFLWSTERAMQLLAGELSKAAPELRKTVSVLAPERAALSNLDLASSPELGSPIHDHIEVREPANCVLARATQVEMLHVAQILEPTMSR
ncbi:MAG: hypothetical protein ACRD2L_25650 [Terriglobia bacterium]